jgi:hypothetical protein
LNLAKTAFSLRSFIQSCCTAIQINDFAKASQPPDVDRFYNRPHPHWWTNRAKTGPTHMLPRTGGRHKWI